MAGNAFQIAVLQAQIAVAQNQKLLAASQNALQQARFDQQIDSLNNQIAALTPAPAPAPAA
jgi:hypothetical protein